MDDEYTTLETLKKLVTQFREQRDWKQFHKPKELAAAIGIEASELNELFLWHDNDAIDEKLKDAKFRQEIAHEMMDIFSYILSMADMLKINVAASLVEKMKINAKKYPVDQAYGSAAKYNELKES